MTANESPSSTDGIIDELVRILGLDKVLTSIEDRYVYSHRGAFGIELADMPIAVVTVDSSPHNLMELIATNGIEVVTSVDDRELGTQRP